MELFNNKSIGVMDSGVGGLTVLKQLQQLCPNETFLYYGDTKNLPYGEKSKEEIIEIVKEIFDFFETQNVKAVVLACNTTSATAYETLKNNYSFKIYPLIQVISKYIAQDKSINRVGVMATPATVKSRKYTDELKKYDENMSVIEQACPLLVPIVEKKLDNIDLNEVLNEYLRPILKFNPDKVILGCTHYPYLLDEMLKITKRNLFINPAELFASLIKDDLIKNKMLANKEIGAVRYLASSNPGEFKKNANLFMSIDIEPELVLLPEKSLG